MFWRITRREFEENGNAGNRRAFEKLVADGTVPGLLFYMDGVPFGWCAVGPRNHFPSLNRSPVLKPVDDRPVWSMVCFYLLRPFRRRGLSPSLVQLVLDYARSRGAAAVEAYPDIKARNTADSYMGIEKVYRSLGFEEAARRKPHRPILRYEIT